MTWWAQVLLWTALVATAAAVILLLARSLWHKALALLAELGVAADRLDVLDRELGTLAERTAPGPDLAVFADPAELRRTRAQTRGADTPAPAHRARHRASAAPKRPGGRANAVPG